VKPTSYSICTHCRNYSLRDIDRRTGHRIQSPLFQFPIQRKAALSSFIRRGRMPLEMILWSVDSRWRINVDVNNPSSLDFLPRL
jgi:hypothetical protein